MRVLAEEAPSRRMSKAGALRFPANWSIYEAHRKGTNGEGRRAPACWALPPGLRVPASLAQSGLYRRAGVL